MLKRTSLFEEHQGLKGRLVDFGGWELPVQYSGVLDEHLACREHAGLFDVSHMGEIHVEGIAAESYLNEVVTNNVASLAVGQAQYTVMCHETGGIVDDLVIYRRGIDRFLVVVNASNTEKDFNHFLKTQAAFLERSIKARIDGAESLDYLKVTNQSSCYSQIAIQGPKASVILQELTSVRLDSIKTYWFTETDILGNIAVIIARTGYTGEDGFEIYSPWDKGPGIWRALMKVGVPRGMKPCGLGSRDTLRLEMKYPLYGNELSDDIHPLEARLGWVVKFDKENFIGKSALVRVKADGSNRQLVGLKLLGKGIPRHGYELFSTEDHQSSGQKIGFITSGTHSPSLKMAIAVAYVDAEFSKIGSHLTVDIRGTKVPAEVIQTPFYKRPY